MAAAGKRAFGLSLLISAIGILALAAIIHLWFAVCTALLMLGGSATRAVVAARTGQRPAVTVWGGVTLGHLAAGLLVGGLLFGAYFWAASYTRSFCEATGRAPTVAEREQRLAEMGDMAWLKALMENLTNKGEFVFDCDRQRAELDALLNDGTCPTYLPVDVQCRCGDDAHASAERCEPPRIAACFRSSVPRRITCEDP